MPEDDDLNALLKQAEKQASIMVLTKMLDAEGQPFYVYLTINLNKYPEYIEAHLLQKSIHLPDFGTIIKSGPGYPPPESVMREMEEKHGFNHNFEKEMTEALIKELEGVKGKHTLKAKQEQKFPYAKPHKPEENN